MKELYYAKTDLTPLIRFDKQQNLFEICGDSRPEGGAYFYLPIHEWIEQNGATVFNEGTRFNFKMDYFNSCSTRGIYRIIKAIMKVTAQSALDQINWYYADEGSKEEGEDIADECETKFNYIFQEIID